MLSRLFAARLIMITVLFVPVGWLTLAGPGAQAAAGSAARAGATAGASAAARTGAAARTAGGPRPDAALRPDSLRAGGRSRSQVSMALPGAVRAAIRVAARQPAPLVAGSSLAATKRGLPAPPMSAAMLRANAVKQAAVSAFLRAAGRQAGTGVKCVSRACRRQLPAARRLKATQEAQARDYYCGPATVSEMLRQMDTKVSQRVVARQLRTDRTGTDWSNARGYPVPHVLNANQRRNDYVAVALPWSPTNRQVRTYEKDLVVDINRHGGVPLAGNAYEVPGGPHLAGHPQNQSISHWFDIRGYRNYGATTEYEDSVHGAPSIGWSAAVPAYSALSSRTIVYILGARGYDW